MSVPESRGKPVAQRWIEAAKERLGIDHLVLIVFDSALPQSDAWDVGTGTPYSALARDFFKFAKELGFDGIQFGPQGAVGRGYPSPYDSKLFSRNPLSIALDALPEVGLAGFLSGEEVARSLTGRPPGVEGRAAHAFAYDRHAALIGTVAERMASLLDEGAASGWVQRYEAWAADNQDWLVPDALHHAISVEHGARDCWPVQPEVAPDFWNLRHQPVATGGAPALLGRALPPRLSRRLLELRRRYDDAVRRYALTQFVAMLQHEALRGWASGIGLELYGDLQIGGSDCDSWYLGWTALPGYRLGAPPSRTNPEGQAWGYAVLDPRLYLEPDGALGPALRLLAWRAERAFLNYDRVRIDHPHGLVCPWVYRAGTTDELDAVRHGARLFSSPDLDDHRDLAQFALVGPDQLDRSQPRHADAWVKALTEPQVEAFARAFDVIAKAAQRNGGVDRLICEVLSTLPVELDAVLRRHRRGRFRVTQKAKPDDPADVYSCENARPEDWVMLGNHDTPPIWQLIERWRAGPQLVRQAEYLTRRLVSDESARPARLQRLLRDSGELAHAKLADGFLAPARNVMVSFLDLMGFEDSFNVPGTVSEQNWTLRIGRDFRNVHAERVAEGRALSPERALRLALERLAPDCELLRQG